MARDARPGGPEGARRRAPSAIGLACLVGAAALAAGLWAQGPVLPGFTSAVSEKLMAVFGLRFGPPARPRLEDWKRHAAARAAGHHADLELLEQVNRYLNRIRFVEDAVHWGAADYWATPAESVASNGADCEDFSIAKYFLLKELGVPIDRLRLTYVKALRLNQAHMVLAYYPRPDADPLVLDNLEDSIRPASQRTDLVPVYGFNDEVVWVEARGRVGSPTQIRNWSGLLERLQRELRT